MDDEILNPTRRSFLGAAALVVASAAGAQSISAPSSELRGVSVSVLADALGRVGRNPMTLAMSPDIKPLTPAGRTVIGPAITTKWQAGQGRMTPDDVRRFMFEPLDQAEAGSIWVVAGGTNRLLSLFGGVIGVACKRNGMSAAITDNGCRDLAAFAEMGLPLFARASVPYGPADIVKPVAANVAVVCGGVEVNPGDLVAADVDGVIVIPKNIYPDVLDAAAEILAKEQQILNKLTAGESLSQAYTL
jgi:4-hydroxy-4-methyl-2-oxoglutarate aldolase